MEVTLTTGRTVETGCYVDGHWGQYGPARAIEVAADLGWDDSEAAELASKHMASMGPSDSDGLTDDEFEVMVGQGGAADDAETYLNSITPDGYAWGWSDGEFFLWPMHEWTDDDPSADPCACNECAAERVANLPGAPLTYSGRTYSNGEWTDDPIPTGGESVSMGTLGMAPTSTGEEVHAYEFPLTVWGDYAGGIVERSNWRVLTTDYADYVIDVYGGYGSHYVAVPVSLARSNPAVWDELAQMARALEDYPVIDDEDMSRLEMELADEAWDAYLKMDLDRALDDRGVTDDELDAIDPDSIRETFYRLTYAQAYGPEAESATDVHFPFFDAVADELATLIRARAAETADDRARHGGTVSLDRPTDPNQSTLGQ